MSNRVFHSILLLALDGSNTIITSIHVKYELCPEVRYDKTEAVDSKVFIFPNNDWHSGAHTKSTLAFVNL